MSKKRNREARGGKDREKRKLMLIAIIEDEEDLLELLEFNLQKEGFEFGFLNSKRVKRFYQRRKSRPFDSRQKPSFCRGHKICKGFERRRLQHSRNIPHSKKQR